MFAGESFSRFPSMWCACRFVVAPHDSQEVPRNGVTRFNKAEVDGVSLT